MKAYWSMALAIAGSCVALNAEAHVAIVGPAFANKTQEIIFGVGHGCEGADTYRVRVQIPAGFASVRPLTSDFGRTTLEKDAAGNVIAITWQKPDSNALEADTQYYKLAVRLKVPDQAFTSVFFPTTQTCRAADGTLLTTEWSALPGEPGEAAPVLTILPARVPGWNKYSVPQAIPELAPFFQDAAIVWRGSSAYSANPATMALIENTPGVTSLAGGLEANDEIWVRY